MEFPSVPPSHRHFVVLSPPNLLRSSQSFPRVRQAETSWPASTQRQPNDVTRLSVLYTFRKLRSCRGSLAFQTPYVWEDGIGGCIGSVGCFEVGGRRSMSSRYFEDAAQWLQREAGLPGWNPPVLGRKRTSAVRFFGDSVGSVLGFGGEVFHTVLRVSLPNLASWRAPN